MGFPYKSYHVHCFGVLVQFLVVLGTVSCLLSVGWMVHTKLRSASKRHMITMKRGGGALPSGGMPAIVDRYRAKLPHLLDFSLDRTMIGNRMDALCYRANTMHGILTPSIQSSQLCTAQEPEASNFEEKRYFNLYNSYFCIQSNFLQPIEKIVLKEKD